MISGVSTLVVWHTEALRFVVSRVDGKHRKVVPDGRYEITSTKVQRHMTLISL